MWTLTNVTQRARRRYKGRENASRNTRARPATRDRNPTRDVLQRFWPRVGVVISGRVPGLPVRAPVEPALRY